jgi:RPA family protein
VACAVLCDEMGVVLMESRKDLNVFPTCRVFFDEFLKSDFILQEDGSTFLVTPTGARCKELFGVGEVEEVEARGNIFRLKLNDLTATLSLYASRRILGDDITAHKERKRRTFIAFRGTVHIRERAGARTKIMLLAEEVGTVEERVRNGWILNTARRTMERIDALRISPSALPNKEANEFSGSGGGSEFQEHYALDDDTLDVFANMAINAVTRMWLQYHTRAKELVVGLLKKAGKSGVAREQLVSVLKTQGFKTEWVEELIEELIVEEICYEPNTGVLKVFTSSKNPVLT